MKNTSHHISGHLEVKELSPQGNFSGHASVFSVTDLQRDQVMQGAFEFSLKQWQHKKQWPLCLWQHDISNPIGYWKHIEEDQKGLFVEGQLILNVQKGQDAYHLMKQGVVTGLSIGFRPIIAHKDTKQRIRKIFQVDLVEISLVTMPANPAAHIEMIKATLA